MTQKLPQAILSTGMQQELLQEFHQKLKNMISAYAQLPWHLSEEAIPRNPKHITTERLAEYVEKMKAGLNEDSRTVWQKLYSDALVQIKVIRLFFDAFPDAEFEVDENISIPVEIRVKCTNKIECVDRAAMVEVPDACREYYDAVRDVEIAMCKVNEIEGRNNIRISEPYRIAGELTGISDNPVKFADMWINDGFKVKKQTLS